ncbi:MAG: alpha/beta hydrolase [Planctomycetales bacterium]|nr:alpha/beta hydrolase [Planctomycetales bacterium]
MHNSPFLSLSVCFSLALASATQAAEPIVLNVWPGTPPGETKELPAEADQTKPEDKLIAGRRIIKLGNVSTPQIAVYQPPADKRNGTAVVICPGGGHYILAYDLEGTEIAQWLNTQGITGIVLKYRVPFRDPDERWKAAVQDAQRAMALVRHHAAQWDIDPNRIGICGFSAGGETAALTAIFTERQYEPIDSVDQLSSRPDFAMLIYAAGLVEKDTTTLHDYIKVSKDTPPMFFVHAYDDRVSAHHPLSLASALKQVGVSAELHLYATGGHGYGLRPTEEPVNQWPQQAEKWLARQVIVPKSEPSKDTAH